MNCKPLSTTLLTPVEYRESRRRLNYLRRVLDVQDFYQENFVEGQSIAHVHRNHVGPRFHISYNVLLKYLGINARREIKTLSTTLAAHTAALNND